MNYDTVGKILVTLGVKLFSSPLFMYVTVVGTVLAPLYSFQVLGLMTTFSRGLGFVVTVLVTVNSTSLWDGAISTLTARTMCANMSLAS